MNSMNETHTVLHTHKYRYIYNYSYMAKFWNILNVFECIIHSSWTNKVHKRSNANIPQFQTPTSLTDFTVHLYRPSQLHSNSNPPTKKPPLKARPLGQHAAFVVVVVDDTSRCAAMRWLGSVDRVFLRFHIASVSLVSLKLVAFIKVT